MAAPNFANVMEQIAFFNDGLDEFEKDTAAASTGWVDILANYIADLDGDTVGARALLVEDQRSAAAGALDPALIRAHWDAISPDVSQAINKPFISPDQTWEDLYDYMITNSQGVQSRSLTFGSVSAGASNSGDGNFYRLTVDENGHDLEGWITDTFTATVIEDENQVGVSFEETWELKGTDAAPDELQFKGSGLFEVFRSQSERDSATYVKNPGFEVFTGTVPTAMTDQTPTSIDGWTITTGGGNIQMSVDQLYRTPPGSSTSYSVIFNDNDTLSQNLLSVNGTQFDPNTPYWVCVPVYRASSCDGTLTITMGNVNRAVTVTTLNNSAWNLVTLVASPDENYWYANLNQNTMDFSIQLASRTTGTLYVDAIQVFPWIRVGARDDARQGRGSMGTYVLPVSGPTPFVKGETFSWTDSESTRGVNNYWSAVGGLGYLPHAPAAATEVTAAGGRTLTFADADPDTITASSGSFISDNFAAGQTLTVAGTSSNNGTYTIATVTALVITVISSDTLVAEGPISSTATLNAVPTIPDK